MAFYFLNVTVPCCVWMQIHIGGKQPRKAGTRIFDFGLSLVVSVIFQLVVLSLYSGKGILTQTVCRAISAVQTAQPQYVASNCSVKYMHQLYLLALKL